MLAKRTILETYYAINSALQNYLSSTYYDCPILKYGVDPAQLGDAKNSQGVSYPYFQTYITNIKQNSRTTTASGILTNFDYQISFFTAPNTSLVNDSLLFYPYEVLKNILSDTQTNLLGDIASLLQRQEVLEFNVVSGQMVPSAVLICKMRAVCAYVAIVPGVSESTDLDSAILIEGE